MKCDLKSINNPNQTLHSDITDVIKEDVFSPLSLEWRKLQRADHKRWSRRYLLPLIKIACLSLSWITLIFKRLIPLQLGSERLLNKLSCFFMKYCVSPEAQMMLYRHFSVESALVHFIAHNSGARDIQLPILKPTCPEQLGDINGTNATLLHDTIILNLFAGLSKSKSTQIAFGSKVQKMEFSGFDLPEFSIHKTNIGRLVNLDFESCLYITVLVLTLCFTRKQIENAVGSLFLDTSLMTCLANLTGSRDFKQWTVFAPGEPLQIPLDPASYLYKHILIHEYAYNQLQQLQAKQQVTKNTKS